jgi:cytidylate kinase
MYDILLDGEDVTWAIRERRVESEVSPVSTYAGVREAMTTLQRKIGRRGKVVMVGRDIGTVVFPEAKLKIYLDASIEARAQRRFTELQCRGEKVLYNQILEDLRRRDGIDSNRQVAPLKPASDAKIVMTDGMDREKVLENVITLVDQIRRKHV